MVWNDVEVYLVADRAYQLAQQGRYEEAAILFEGLAVVAPRNAYVRGAQAALRTRLQSPAEAFGIPEATRQEPNR